MATPPVLEIRELTVRRDRRCLLAGISLEVAPASLHLLVGPNGAGKSTLFAAVLGLIDFAGSIEFHWRGAGRIGYVPQSFAVDRTLPLTVGEFLALSRQRRPVCIGVGRGRRRHNEELLARVGLERFSDRPLGALSGGELQRVLLANAVDPPPELLLLDEPASGLDERSVQQLERVLLELKLTHGTSAFMVSHDLAQVHRLADRVTLLDREVLRTGKPARVLADYASGAFAPRTGFGS
jgi:zinc transport system ATP-binding protein